MEGALTIAVLDAKLRAVVHRCVVFWRSSILDIGAMVVVRCNAGDGRGVGRFVFMQRRVLERRYISCLFGFVLLFTSFSLPEDIFRDVFLDVVKEGMIKDLPRC